MKKRVVSMIAFLMLTTSFSSTTFAAKMEDSSALNPYSTVSSEIEGVENDNTNAVILSNSLTSDNSNAILSSNAVAVCVDYLEIDKKFLSNKWRALGETSISGGVTWDIKMELELWKDDHISTTASKTSSDTSYYSAGTKYVSGDSEGQFSAEGIFRVFDDNNVKIHEQELYVNR